jgi:hypothetical protein
VTSFSRRREVEIHNKFSASFIIIKRRYSLYIDKQKYQLLLVVAMNRGDDSKDSEELEVLHRRLQSYVDAQRIMREGIEASQLKIDQLTKAHAAQLQRMESTMRQSQEEAKVIIVKHQEANANLIETNRALATELAAEKARNAVLVDELRPLREAYIDLEERCKSWPEKIEQLEMAISEKDKKAQEMMNAFSIERERVAETIEQLERKIVIAAEEARQSGKEEGETIVSRHFEAENTALRQRISALTELQASAVEAVERAEKDVEDMRDFSERTSRSLQNEKSTSSTLLKRIDQIEQRSAIDREAAALEIQKIREQLENERSRNILRDEAYLALEGTNKSLQSELKKFDTILRTEEETVVATAVAAKSPRSSSPTSPSSSAMLKKRLREASADVESTVSKKGVSTVVWEEDSGADLADHICIVNRSGDPEGFPLKGYELVAEMQGLRKSFVIPDVNLPPGKELKVFCGPGARSAIRAANREGRGGENLLWSDEWIWGEDGALMQLFDPSGVRVDAVRSARHIEANAIDVTSAGKDGGGSTCIIT